MNAENILQDILDSDVPPDCDVYHQFTHSVTANMRRSGFTRAGLATRMNEALKVLEIEVDDSKLNKWLAPSQPNYMPVHYLPALVWALKSMDPANILLEPLMYKAVDLRAQKLQQSAEFDVQIEHLKHQKQTLMEELTPKI